MTDYKHQQVSDGARVKPGNRAQIGPFNALVRPGQIQPGDHVSFTVGGTLICAPVALVLFPGTCREEIVYNRKKNHYFITSMALDGSSSHKSVQVRSGAAGGAQ